MRRENRGALEVRLMKQDLAESRPRIPTAETITAPDMQ
jgi:hypothetical protein